MQTVQFAIADAAYAAALQNALVRSGPWQVLPMQNPDPGRKCVVVMDEESHAIACRCLSPTPNAWC